MSLHQIIYTSCMRGINGVNDGQQVFSYDAAFKDANNDEVKSLFTYQLPALAPGVIMTEELAPTMPKAFIYRKLENGMCALALNTYLGRDYMGSAGRFGNHLSHVVLADREDLQHYPCEFYGSGLHRDHMQFEEVNNPERPDFLPEPVLERGYTVDIDAVIDFLGIGDRIEIFKNMLHAVFSFESERKRVVICDEPENIIMWIAALEYALPLRTALGISFTTYEYDPSLSASQICGVIPNGTKYNYESRNQHFVFDLLENTCETFEKDGEFFDFIDTAMSFSYDSLQDFHRFLTDGYTYDQADFNMYAAYRLYTLLSDGICGMSLHDIESALNFAKDFALPEEKKRILQLLLAQSDALMQTEIAAFLFVMRYLIAQEMRSDEDRSVINGIMVDRVLNEVLCNEGSEDEFASFYSEVDAVCKADGFSISTELMRKHNREKLFGVMRNDIATWKIAFITKVVCSFVKDQHVSVNDLLIDTPLGQTYHGLVHAIYPVNAQSGFFFVTKILDEFASDSNYLVNMALNLEGMLLGLPNGSNEAASLWKYFAQTMLKHHRTDFTAAYSVLNKYQRYEQINMLYTLAISDAAGVFESQRIFGEHYRTFVARNEVYAGRYADQILNDYHRRIADVQSESAYDAKVELFEIISKEKKDVPFAENLVREVVKPISFESPGSKNAALIQGAFEYLYNTLRKPISGKLLFLVIGLVLERCSEREHLLKSLQRLAQLTTTDKADMSRITEQAAERYFDWILPGFCELSEQSEEMESLYDLFRMPDNAATIFFTSCAKIYLKRCKDDPDYKVFCQFLRLVFLKGDQTIRESIGKLLCKLSKQKLADLDRAVKQTYSTSKNAQLHWEAIRKVAEDTNPILNSLSNLFRRKKD